MAYANLSFKIDEESLAEYKAVTNPFPNDLAAFVYYRTYSRRKPDGTNEEWWETVRRVVEGTYSIQKDHINGHNLGWYEDRAQRSALEMFDMIFNFKFLPPGRGLWAMGTNIVHEKKLSAALNNCAFCTTKDLATDPCGPFVFVMDASMLGVGCGFDTKGAGTRIVYHPHDPPVTIVVSDSREGWVESLRTLLLSYFVKDSSRIVFDYSKIRPAGSPLETFGGVSSGPGPLEEMHRNLNSIFLSHTNGSKITSRTIVDIFNVIGRCVVAGGVRRTALIAFGEYNDTEFFNLKDYEQYPYRQEWGWTSNNSVIVHPGDDYSKFIDQIVAKGEPGFAWLYNMQAYSRMCDLPDHKDHRAQGGNPCLEQTLEPWELCTLVETFPFRHDTLEDYKRTCKKAYLYAKTVTLAATHWPQTNRVMLRNRRIGCSVSGIAQFLESRGIEKLGMWLSTSYEAIQEFDRVYSDWFCVPQSIKTTSIKPSGTVSILADATPGMHYPQSQFYIRRVRDRKDSPLLLKLKEAGYHVEPAVYCEDTTSVVEIPMRTNGTTRTQNDVSMWEQFSLAAFLQSHWADNQVSCTVTFDPKTEGPQLKPALNYFQYHLKGISMLPRQEVMPYPQLPYESITEEEYTKRTASLKPVAWGSVEIDVPTGAPDCIQFCDGETCLLVSK